jgi:hypothetical protein
MNIRRRATLAWTLALAACAASDPAPHAEADAPAAVAADPAVDPAPSGPGEVVLLLDKEPT